MEFTNLSNLQLDVLREIGNIGAGNAATSMSQLINKKIDMKVPSVRIVDFDEVMEIIGGPEQLIVAIMFHIKGDVRGFVYLILCREEAEQLVSEMMPGENSLFTQDNQLNSVSISILKEVGNILTGSYLSALSDFLQLNMQPSVPYFSFDMAGAVLTVGLVEVSQVTDFAIIIDTKINEDNGTNGINGQFFLIPEPAALVKIFNTLGIELYD